MYEHIPQRQNAYALWLISAFCLLSLASFITASFFEMRWILQAIGLILLVPAIQLIARFAATRYLYRICPYEDGNVDLDIYAYRGGKKMQLVCRLGLEEITAANPLSIDNKKPSHKLRRYNYCPDLFPKNALVLSITNGDGDCEIIFCPDEKMADIVTPKNGVHWTYTPPEAANDEDTDGQAAEHSSENSEN